MDGTLITRAKVVAFYGVKEGETVTYHRMQGFTALNVTKNPKEYTRQYVDEEFEQTDVTGFSPSMAYTFDRYKGNKVHDDIVKLTDGEKIGSEAIRDIVVVDLSVAEGSPNAYKRSFSVIPDTEGDSMDAYTYSGTFRTKGEKVEGTATVGKDALTCTFEPAANTAAN